MEKLQSRLLLTIAEKFSKKTDVKEERENDEKAEKG